MDGSELESILRKRRDKTNSDIERERGFWKGGIAGGGGDDKACRSRAGSAAQGAAQGPTRGAGGVLPGAAAVQSNQQSNVFQDSAGKITAMVPPFSAREPPDCPPPPPSAPAPLALDPLSDLESEEEPGDEGQAADTEADGDVTARRRIDAVVEELRFCEKMYCPKLRRLVEEGLPELLGRRLSGLKSPDDVFCCADQLYRFHSQELLPALCDARSVADIAGVFVEAEPKFMMYVRYYGNTKKSTELVQKYKEFFNIEEPPSPKNPDLSALLLEPVAQLPRYLALLRALLAAYAANSRDAAAERTRTLGALQAALAGLAGVLKLFEEAGVLDNLRGCSIDLTEKGRLLRQREFMVVKASKKRTLMRCFLFERLILFTAMNSKGEYRFKHAIAMEELELSLPSAEHPSSLRVWARARPTHAYRLEGDPLDCAQWGRALRELLDVTAGAGSPLL